MERRAKTKREETRREKEGSGGEILIDGDEERSVVGPLVRGNKEEIASKATLVCIPA